MALAYQPYAGNETNKFHDFLSVMATARSHAPALAVKQPKIPLAGNRPMNINIMPI
jgi:hypothetical protein